MMMRTTEKWLRRMLAISGDAEALAGDPKASFHPCDRCGRPTMNPPNRTFIVCDLCAEGKNP